MKTCLLFLCCLFSSLSISGQGFFIYQDIQADSVVYYASNTNYCPYSITLQPELDSIAWGNAHFFVIAAQTTKKKIVAYPKPISAGKITYQMQAYLGDAMLKSDTSYIYSLPYTPKKRYRIMQGYNGRFSHRNQYALDFKMPVGTPIYATRGGVVIRVKQDSDKHGRTSEYASFGNHIIIYHEDGTMAYYYHLSKDGSKVKVGDKVTQRQIIALSGNTGWSTAPHLHFIVKYTLKDGYGSIPTWFCTTKNPRQRVKSKHRYRACE